MCLVPLSTLLLKYNLRQGDPVNVRVASTNSIGTSPFIQTQGVLIETVPIAPQSVRKGNQTTEQQIHVLWDAITA